MFCSIMTGTCAYRLRRVFRCIFNGWTFVFFTFNAAHYQICPLAALARVAAGEKLAGRGGRPRGPLPSPPPARRAPGGSEDGTARPGRVTRGGGNSRAPAPRGLPLSSSRRRPRPSVPDGGGSTRGGGCGYLRAPAHRNSRPAAGLERLPAPDLRAGSAGGWEARPCHACQPNMAAGARRAPEGA